MATVVIVAIVEPSCSNQDSNINFKGCINQIVKFVKVVADSIGIVISCNLVISCNFVIPMNNQAAYCCTVKDKGFAAATTGFGVVAALEVATTIVITAYFVGMDCSLTKAFNCMFTLPPRIKVVYL